MSDADYSRQYARAINGLPEPHPEIAHTPISHVLTKLADPNNNSSTVSELARACLADPYQMPILRDALMDEGHPMTHEYNWQSVPRGLEIQRHIRAAAEALAHQYNLVNPSDRPLNSHNVLYMAGWGHTLPSGMSPFPTTWDHFVREFLPPEQYRTISREEFNDGILRIREQRRAEADTRRRAEDAQYRANQRAAGYDVRHSRQGARWKRNAMRTIASLKKVTGGYLTPEHAAVRFFGTRPA